MNTSEDKPDFDPTPYNDAIAKMKAMRKLNKDRAGQMIKMADEIIQTMMTRATSHTVMMKGASDLGRTGESQLHQLIASQAGDSAVILGMLRTVLVHILDDK